MKYTVYCTVYLTVNTSDILKALIFKLLFLAIPSFKICLFCPDHRNILRLVRKEWSQIPGSGARMPCVEHTVQYTVQEVDLGRNKFREFFSKHWFLQSAKFHNYVTYLRDKKCQNFNLEKIVIPTLGLGMRSQNLAAHCCQLKWPERESCHCSADHSS